MIFLYFGEYLESYLKGIKQITEVLKESLYVKKDRKKGALCYNRNAISWKKKFELDVWYVDNISFLTYCKVILTTIKKVLQRDGISAEGQATIEAFNGNN